MKSLIKLDKALAKLRESTTLEEMETNRKQVWKLRDKIMKEASEQKLEAQKRLEEMKRQAKTQRKKAEETKREAELERKVFFRTAKSNPLRLRKGW